MGEKGMETGTERAIDPREVLNPNLARAAQMVGGPAGPAVAANPALVQAPGPIGGPAGPSLVERAVEAPGTLSRPPEG